MNGSPAGTGCSTRLLSLLLYKPAHVKVALIAHATSNCKGLGKTALIYQHSLAMAFAACTHRVLR